MNKFTKWIVKKLGGVDPADVKPREITLTKTGYTHKQVCVKISTPEDVMKQQHYDEWEKDRAARGIGHEIINSGLFNRSEIKSNCEGLKRAGIEPNMSDLRYIKLAEYENREERAQSDFYLTCYPIMLESKPTKTIIDKTSVYELDDEPKDETKWAKNNPTINVDGKSVNDMIMRRFMERR